MSFERLDKKREEVEADYKIWKISEEKYLLMLEAIEGKKWTETQKVEWKSFYFFL